MANSEPATSCQNTYFENSLQIFSLNAPLSTKNISEVKEISNRNLDEKGIRTKNNQNINKPSVQKKISANINQPMETSLEKKRRKGQ